MVYTVNYLHALHVYVNFFFFILKKCGIFAYSYLIGTNKNGMYHQRQVIVLFFKKNSIDCLHTETRRRRCICICMQKQKHIIEEEQYIYVNICI